MIIRRHEDHDRLLAWCQHQQVHGMIKCRASVISAHSSTWVGVISVTSHDTDDHCEPGKAERPSRKDETNLKI